MVWPLTRVWVRLGLVPRRLTRSASSKPPSLALDEAMLTPGSWRRVSATFLAGSLPTSSEVTSSTWVLASRLASIAFSMLPRMPVTTTASRSLASCVADADGLASCCRLASCASATPAMPSAMAILMVNAFLRTFMLFPLPGLVMAPAPVSRGTSACSSGGGGPSLRGLASLLAVLQVLQVPARDAERAEPFVFDQAHRHALEHRAHRPLVDQPRAERAARQEIRQLRHDAAG